MAPAWVAFLGLAGLLVIVLLVLARLSQQALEQEPTAPAADPGGAAGVDRTPETDDPAGGIGPDPFSQADDPAGGATSNPGDPQAAPGPAGNADAAAGVRVPSLDPERSRPDRGELASSTSRDPPEERGGTGSDTAPAPAEHGREPAAEKATHAVADPGSGSASTATAQPAAGDLSPAALLANVALTHGLFAGILLVGAWYFEIPARAFGVVAEPWSTGLPAVAAGLGFGLALWVANEAGARLADAIGVGYDESLRELLGPDTVAGWVVLLGAVLPLIAVGEELVFRAALIGVPAAGFGTAPWALAVLSSIAFALGHGAQGTAGIVVTGVLGFVLAAGYIVTGSLLVVVVAHYVVNALEFVVHEGLDIDAASGSAPD